MSKLPPMVPWRIIQHWKCLCGRKWRRRTDICGEKSFAIADGFLPWRINCFPNPKDSHLFKAYWTSEVIRFGNLRTARPVIVANARFWSSNPSGRSLIQFVANAAPSRVLKLAMSRKSLISAYCRYGSAWIEITFALDMQSARTVRTCHSVGTTCSFEAGTNSSGHKKLTNILRKK